MIIALDTETYKGSEEDGYTPTLDTREFKLGCVMDQNEKYAYFYTPDEMWNYLRDRIKKEAKSGNRTFIYAHHHEYDFLAYAGNRWIEDENLKIISRSPFIANYRINGKTWAYFLDTISFYRMSLDKVGETIGLNKMEMPERPRSVEEIKPYVLRDTTIVLKAMVKLKETVNKLGYNPRKMMTAGQLALSSFRQYAQRNKILWILADKGVIRDSPFHRKIREAFRGARVEAFKTGYFEEVTAIDANSLYPYCMANIDFPDLKNEILIENPLTDLKIKDILKRIGVVRCTAKSPENIEIGYLPIRFKRGSSFIEYSPRNTKMRGTWTTLELKKAVELGYEIRDIEWCSLYPQAKLNPFKDYMEKLYDLRLSEKGYMKSVIKLLMNNLFGKFGQFRGTTEIKLIRRSETMDYLEMGWRVMQEHGTKYIATKHEDAIVPKFGNAIISALVTAKARDLMYDNMMKVGLDDMVYTDTDSIFFIGDHDHKFKISNKMGEFKYEKDDKGPVIKRECKVLGEKRYYIGNVVKIAGLLKRDQSKKIIDNEQSVMSMRMVGIKMGLNTNLADMGSFRPTKIAMRRHAKKDDILPNYINEVKE